MAQAQDASTELIPIQVKEALNRDTFPGRVGIEKTMHATMGPGSYLDRNLGDAIFNVEAAKKELLQKVVDYANLQLTAQVAGMPPPSCAPASVTAIIGFIKQVKTFIQELTDLIQSIRDLILYMMSLIKRIQSYIQRQLTSIATLINEICNFHLPALPSLPNLFGNLHFDGFKFTKGMFDFRLSFDTHFAFGNCKLRNVSSNILQNAVQNYSSAKGLAVNPDGSVSPAMTDTFKALFNSPLTGGSIASATPSVEDLAKTTPVFKSTFSPTTDFVGSLLKPSSVVSNYRMPVAEFAPQVLSLLGGDTAGIIADQNEAGTVGAAGSSPTTVVDQTTIPWSQFIPKTRSYCQSKVTLANIEAASQSWTVLNPGADQTTPAWAVAWAWLRLMNQCRVSSPVTENQTGGTLTVHGRGGVPWIPTFQKLFAEIVAGASPSDPCYNDIHTDIPWNATQSGLSSMTFWSKVTALDPATRGQILWALSYLEASLLGYDRETKWDAYAPGEVSAPETTHPLVEGFLTGPTGADLDYQALAIPATAVTVPLTLNSGGLAKYPSTISVPDFLVPAMTTVIGACDASIRNAPKYQSQHSRSMYVYATDATAVAIDPYSQFWRDFASNWADLTSKESGLQAIVFNYPKILLDALNPRATGSPFQGVGVSSDPNAPYPLLQTDYSDRSTPFGYHYEDPVTTTGLTWVPGWPWLPTPSIKQMYLPVASSSPAYGVLNDYNEPVYALPQYTDDPLADGWTRVADPDDPTATILGAFNPAAYLARADIQALPYTEQQALVAFNQAFDDVVNTGAALLGTTDQAMSSLQASAKAADEQLVVMKSWATLSTDGHPYVLAPEGFDPSVFFGGPAVNVPDGVKPDLSATSTSYFDSATASTTAPAEKNPTKDGLDETTRLRYRKQILQMVPVPGTIPSTSTVSAANPNVSTAQPWLNSYGARVITPGGSSGGGSTTDGGDFTFTQGAPSETWVIKHDLNKFPTVTVVGTDGILVEGYEVNYHIHDASLVANTVTLTFHPPFQGTAYLH